MAAALPVAARGLPDQASAFSFPGRFSGVLRLQATSARVRLGQNLF
jgi:hypothetical protein